jgi:hypothetical protein
MATWSTPLPPADVEAGDPGHPEMHNQLRANVVEVRSNVDLALPANDTRLTAGAAGVATVRALGTTSTTAAAGNDVRLLAGTAVAQANSTATDVAGLVTDFNALLTKLRTRGILAP